MGTRTALAIIVVTSSFLFACGGSAQTAPTPHTEEAPIVAPPLDIAEAMKQPDLPPRDEESATTTHAPSHTIGQNNPDPVVDSENRGGPVSTQSNATASTGATQQAMPRMRSGGGGGGRGGGGGGRGGGGRGGGSSGAGAGTTTQSYGPQTMQ